MMPVRNPSGVMLIRILMFFLLFGSFYGFSRDSQTSVITNIWLINSHVYTGITLPGAVVVGIGAGRNVYYKITDTDNQDEIVAGGLLNIGSNIIEIKNDNFFKASGTHRFLLILKMGEQVLKKSLMIDIQLQSSPDKEETAGDKEKKIKPEEAKENKAVDKTGNAEYSVAMYIEDRFIIEEKKDHQLQVEIDPEKGLLKGNWGQPGIVDGSYPALKARGVPVLPLMMSLLKKAFQKKGAAPAAHEGTGKKPVSKLEHLTIEFKKKDVQGEEKLIKAKIKINLSEFTTK